MKDITDDQTGSIQACLCETELCNEENDREKSGVESLQTTTKKSLITTPPISGEIVRKSEMINTVLDIEETPRAGGGFKVSLDTSQALEDDPEVPGEPQAEGLSCYSCGSLLSPDQTCPSFDPSSSQQIAVCGPGEACLLYTWSRSQSTSATIRQSRSLQIYQLYSSHRVTIKIH